uniref:CarD family transcriptional regulator n=1 Tax=uncultured Methanobrevibacter sp. TaxID=253161 RepID=UPI0025FC04D5
ISTICKTIKMIEDDAKSNNFMTKEVHILNDDIKLMADTANKAQENNKKVIILVSTEEQKNKVFKLLKNAVKVDDLDNIVLKNGEVVVSTGNLSTGFDDKTSNLLVISTEDIESPARKRHTSKMHSSFSNGEKIVFADLKVNDLVVHKNYGIGIFTGIKTITTDGVTKDYQLNKLGTKEWRETKAKVKGNLKAVAKDLIELYAKREKAKGFAFSKDTPWQKEFEDDFPYQETDDQLRCIAEIKKDMESERPMDRLLCGDVGYGKTEVAMRETGMLSSTNNYFSKSTISRIHKENGEFPCKN